MNSKVELRKILKGILHTEDNDQSNKENTGMNKSHYRSMHSNEDRKEANITKKTKWKEILHTFHY
jgi:hypothetical protein